MSTFFFLIPLPKKQTTDARVMPSIDNMSNWDDWRELLAKIRDAMCADRCCVISDPTPQRLPWMTCTAHKLVLCIDDNLRFKAARAVNAGNKKPQLHQDAYCRIVREDFDFNVDKLVAGFVVVRVSAVRWNKKTRKWGDMDMSISTEWDEMRTRLLCAFMLADQHHSRSTAAVMAISGSHMKKQPDTHMAQRIFFKRDVEREACRLKNRHLAARGESDGSEIVNERDVKPCAS